MESDCNKTSSKLPANCSDLPAELFLRLDVEKYLDQLAQSVSLATGERQHLSDLLLADADETFKHLDKRFPKPRLNSRQLSDALIKNAKLTPPEKNAIIQFQKLADDAPMQADFALGNILVANGLITRPQLEQALHQQVTSGRLLGEQLITAGHASTAEIEIGLTLQRKLIACALAVSVGLAPIVSTPAEAAQTSAAMSVSVTVVAHAQMQTIFQATHLNISKDDIVRGYVDAQAASRFSVTSNSRSGYLMQLYPVGDLFDSVQIRGLGNPVQMGMDGGALVQRGLVPAKSTIELSFRFSLRPDVLPGNYPWPLQLSVRSL